MNLKEFTKVLRPRIDLPNISSFIELKRDNKYGRMIIAKEKLQPGDIIAIEEPFFKSLEKNSVQIRCVNCLRVMSTGSIRCENVCKSIEYCSIICRDEANIEFHNYECKYFKEIDKDDGFFLLMSRMLFKSLKICGSLEELMHQIEHIKETLTIFDKIYAVDNDEIFYLSCCFNLECANVYDDLKFVNFYLESPLMKSLYTTNDQREMLKKIILRILGILNRNSFHLKIKEGTIGGLFTFTSLINHSCSPNIDKIKSGNKIILICTLPIEKNEQLFLCYRKPFYLNALEKRQLSLYRQFNFMCDCVACLDENKYCIMKFSHDETNNDNENLIEKYYINCKLIRTHFKDYPSQLLVELICINKKLLNKFVEINEDF